MDLKWEEDFTITVKIQDGTAVISADKGGLLSLANHMISLANEPAGSHLHLDQYNALEDGSAELILEKSAKP